MTPIKPGTAQRLGLRKPVRVYPDTGRTSVAYDELNAWLDRVLAGGTFQLAPFQRVWLNETVRAAKGER